ncbi:ROK family transcriptional regulator [Paenibacillus sp.]|uniref:ROK family transcriptional regulator n=1 Tax=Paenibacillus sp. TaxID=58172 RepID=UPI002D383F5B|nr:ROK family transcriptional regulator [Paenibacillus sp.]HZG84312.1 ROK family transcriptional regulator [Paenibacillus sp.]
MKKTGSLELIKNINRSLVLEQIRNHQPITRAEIAKRLNLSRSTVSLIIDDLIEKKFVVELGFGDSTREGGRRGMKLGFNPKSAYGVGVDIGGTKILMALTDLDGNVVHKEKRPTVFEIPAVIEAIQDFIAQAPVDAERIIAMGIGVPGTFDKNTGVLIDSPALGLHGVNLKGEIEPHFPFPVFLGNDVNLAALGERWRGAGDNADDVVLIALGTGVGGAIIANGELVLGHRSMAGEIGYFITPEEIRQGVVSRPDQFGAFEDKTSGTALNKYGVTAEELFERYEKGDPDTKEIVESFIVEMTAAIANVASLLNPEKVIIGGGVSESLGSVIESIKKKVDECSPNKTAIELARLGGDAGAIGAIAYAFQQIQEQ